MERFLAHSGAKQWFERCALLVLLFICTALTATGEREPKPSVHLRTSPLHVHANTKELRASTRSSPGPSVHSRFLKAAPSGDDIGAMLEGWGGSTGMHQHLIAMRDKIMDSARQQLRSTLSPGAHLVAYIPDNTFLVVSDFSTMRFLTSAAYHSSFLVRSACSPVDSRLWSAACSPVDSRLWSAACPPVDSRLWSAACSPVDNRVWSAACPPVDSRLWSAACPPVDSRLWSAACPPLYSRLWSAA
ncbi:hypothetical protein CYMTET_24697, partial [Cymbomonas tetramitiformis]